MKKRVISALLATLLIFSWTMVGFCEAGSSEVALTVKDTDYNKDEETLTLTVVNNSEQIIDDATVTLESKDKDITFKGEKTAQVGKIAAGGEKKVVFAATIKNYTEGEKMPEADCKVSYVTVDESTVSADSKDKDKVNETYEDFLNKKSESAIMNFINDTGFAKIASDWNVKWQNLVMIGVACVLLYLAIVKQFEPLLLLPIAFGMLLTNLPGADLFHEELFADGHVHWDLFNASGAVAPGLLDYLYLGVKLGIYPCLIFIGVGAMTDFGPLIANPVSLLLGAAAQIGIFATFIGARYFAFTEAQASSIGIIGGADGPTAIFVTTKLAPELLGPIAVAAYSYMALIPVIQTPIMKALTTKKERCIRMKELRKVSKVEKIIFPIVVTVFTALLIPSAGALIGSLMLGNLMRECGVVERLSKTVQNELMNIVTIFLGITVGATATGETFLKPDTLKIIIMGVIAFAVATAGGILLAKLMNVFLPEGKKINPLIGSAGVSAVPMAARVSQKVGQSEDPGNFLLMHAMGPNVAGVIGSAIAAGALLAMFG